MNSCSRSFAGQAGAQVVDGLGQAVERVRDVFAVREAGVAPNVVRAARKAQHISEAWAHESQRQAGFVGLIRDDVRERDGGELRQMRDDAHRPVVRLRVAPDGLPRR